MMVVVPRLPFNVDVAAIVARSQAVGEAPEEPSTVIANDGQARRAPIHQPSLLAKRSNPFFPCAARWIASSQALLAITVVHLVSDSTIWHRDMHPHCRGAVRPGFAWGDRGPRKQRGRRESRVRAAPAVSCAKENRKRTRAYRFSGGNPAFPARWVTAYSALSPVTGLFCHRRPRKVLLLANLTPASGRQDHTASPSAPPALVVRRHHVHRIPPRVRDDREPPLSSGEMRRGKSLICPPR